jgi:hypothetical protein
MSERRRRIMRTVIISLIAGLFLISAAYAAEGDCCDDWDFNHHDNDWHHLSFGRNDDIEMEIDDGDVIITCERRRYKSDEVKITEDYKLYVNGARVDVEDENKELLKKYYNQAIDLHEEAMIIGREGAKIGVEGAKIGAHAVSGVIKLLLLDFDEDEFEREMEDKAERLEEKADKLEERADKLEEMADNLEDMHDDLSRKIPELRELKWF